MIEIIEGRPEDAAAIVEFTKKVGGETDNLTFGAEEEFVFNGSKDVTVPVYQGEIN